MSRTWAVSAALAILAAGSPHQALQAQSPPSAAGGRSYWVYVANESSDLVSRVRFDGREAVEEKTIEVGYHPTDLDGAHGVSVSPDGAFWYVSFAHGRPFGQVWKLRTGTDDLVDSTTVGLFPATMSMSQDGSALFVANFNLHGDPVASSVSAVFTPLMMATAEIETCVRPHGSRVTHDGLHHYSGCLLSDQLVEISTVDLKVTRRLRLSTGHVGLTGDASDMVVPVEGRCSPSWVVASPDDEQLYVTCNARDEILEIDRSSLAVARRWATGAGPYNAALTPDGSRLIVTLKSDQAVAILDLSSGEHQHLETSRPLPHGVVVTPDGRYAFVSNEAVGATRGTVDVIALDESRVVATAVVQYQPGGIAFWKTETSN